MAKRSRCSALILMVLLAAGCNGATDRTAEVAPSSTQPAPGFGEAINPGDFSTIVTNALFPLSSFGTIKFAGSEVDADGDKVQTRSERRLLEKTETVAGVAVAVLEVKDYEDGELVEVTEDYFAQHRDGSVWYFGERVSDFEDGKVVGHEGQWLAGEGANKPGLFMPANPAVGQEFEPERAPGVAEERTKVLQVDVEVTVPSGQFAGCLKVENFDELDKQTGFALYCPKVGLVREEGSKASSELISVG